MATPGGQSGGAAPVVFPIGHYMGPFHPRPGAPPRHFIVRIGWTTPKLPDEAHLDVWAFAHGLPTRIDSERWTREAVVRTAEDAGVADAGAVVENLLERRLLAEVEPGTDQAVEFARTYRMQSLLIGLGNGPDDPVLDGIGIAGLPAVVRVRPRVFELWQWGHLWPDLWSTCESLAEVSRESGSTDPDETEPERVLDFALGALRTLVAHNAAYLDVRHVPGSAG